MIPRKIQRGFTLIELMISIAVIALITASVSGTWTLLVKRQTSYAAQSTLSQAFASARSEAVTSGTTATICPLDHDRECSRNWNLPVTVFLDPLNEYALSSNTELVRIFELPDNGILTASKSGPVERRYFQYNPDGTARGTLGNIVWCPTDYDTSTAIQLRMNFGGRITWAKDSDGDGLKEDVQGQPLSCP